MRAKAKMVAAIAAAAIAAGVPAQAATPSAAQDACSAMARYNAAHVAEALRALSRDVLGKPADLWLEADFDSIEARADACNGRPEGVKFTVNAKYWRDRMQQVRPAVLKVSAVTAAVRTAYAPRWTWGSPPSCIAVLGWKRDGVWFTDNSEAIFGRSLAAMDRDGRALAAGFARECLPVMEAVLRANRLKPELAGMIAEDIAASAAREQEAAEENEEELAPSLRVRHKGRRVPLAYISDSSRRMVLAASKAELMGMKLTSDQLVMLSEWAENVELSGRGGPERLYSGAVRNVVSKHVFGRK